MQERANQLKKKKAEREAKNPRDIEFER